MSGKLNPDRSVSLKSAAVKKQVYKVLATAMIFLRETTVATLNNIPRKLNRPRIGIRQLQIEILKPLKCSSI